jgi:hypothetical protein
MLRPSATEQSPQVADIVRDYAETEAAKRAQAFAFERGLMRQEKQMALSDTIHQMGLEEAKEQSRRATVFSGIGAALSLGAQWWQSKEIDKVIDVMTDEQNAVEKIEKWIQEYSDKTLGVLREATEELKKKGRRKETFDYYGPELLGT